MMTTPQDLEDLAVGFSSSEEIISSTVKLDSLEVLRLCDGIERRMCLSGPKADRLKGAMAAYCGPTGCGLCGIESVAEASRPGFGGAPAISLSSTGPENAPRRSRPISSMDRRLVQRRKSSTGIMTIWRMRRWS